MLRAQEEERKRIAQELHDETVQSLVLLCRQLDTVDDTAGALPSTVTDTLQQSRAIAEEAVERLRDFARTLRPPTLDDLGLVTSIRRLLDDLTERTKANGKLTVQGKERRLPPDTELGLFRIAQEAIRNVERHALATEVTMTLDFAVGEVRLEVHDNGVGFTPPAATANFATSGQLGLLGMQERAQLLGGRLKINSSPGKGTRISVSIAAGEQAAL